MNKIEVKLREVARELSISQTKYREAETSYKAVATYIQNNLDIEIRSFPQGSFKLGTVIKPIGKEDYDIDFVCVLEDYDKNTINPDNLKHLIGDILKGSLEYSPKLEKKEGKRCWTLVFKNGYHIDILPAIYEDDDKEALLHTNKEFGTYGYLKTNPEGYAKWFNEKNKLSLFETRSKAQDSIIEDVPDRVEGSILQKSIQVLKRFRDIMFQNDNDNKPISIIITTIAATLYNGEENIYEVITSFINNYNEVLKKIEGVWYITNPVIEEENFADKWMLEKNKENGFFKFIDGLKDLFITKRLFVRDSIVTDYEASQALMESFGEDLIKKLYENDPIRRNIERKSGELKISRDGKLGTKEGTKIRDHKFYGKIL